jgi:hypothetical protein
MTGVQTLGTWWRWPLMPIASLLGATIASGLLNVVVFFGFMILSGRQPDGWFLLYVVPLLSYGIFGYVVALVAYSLAPRHKLFAGLTMTAVMLVLMALVLMGTYFSPDPQPQFLTHLAVGIPTSVILAAVGLVHMHKSLLESPPVTAGP